MASETKSLFVNSQTKERNANCTKAEVDRLQSLITKRKNVLFYKKLKAAENYNIVRQKLREKKKGLLDSLQDLELQKIRNSIRHAQELHEQELRHKEERQVLEKEKLMLQIMILKKSLD